MAGTLIGANDALCGSCLKMYNMLQCHFLCLHVFTAIFSHFFAAAAAVVAAANCALKLKFSPLPPLNIAVVVVCVCEYFLRSTAN